MKRLFSTLIATTIFVLSSSAQDIITFRDGREVEAKILEITQTEIKYKKFHNPNSPLYTVGQHEVSTIKYEYGEVEEYGTKQAPQPETQREVIAAATQPAKPQLKVVSPDFENEQIIKRSKNLNFSHTNPNKKKYSFFTTKWALTDSSVISNSEVKAVFEQYKYYYYGNSYFAYHNLALVNKLDIPIYIDLGNSFRVSYDKSHCYFDPSRVVSINEGRGGGASVNLGAIAGAFGIGGIVGSIANGISVGGGKSGGTSTTFQDQRIVVVAPKGKEYVSKWESYGEKEISEGENLRFSYNWKNYDKVRLAVKYKNNVMYNEEQTPYKFDYYITYSTDPEFKTYSVLKFTIYVHQVIGLGGKNSVRSNGVYLHTYF